MRKCYNSTVVDKGMQNEQKIHIWIGSGLGRPESGSAIALGAPPAVIALCALLLAAGLAPPISASFPKLTNEFPKYPLITNNNEGRKIGSNGEN